MLPAPRPQPRPLVIPQAEPLQSSALVHDISAFFRTISVPDPRQSEGSALASALRSVSGRESIEASLGALVIGGAQTLPPDAVISAVASFASGQPWASAASAAATAECTSMIPFLFPSWKQKRLTVLRNLLYSIPAHVEAFSVSCVLFLSLSTPFDFVRPIPLVSTPLLLCSKGSTKQSQLT